VRVVHFPNGPAFLDAFQQGFYHAVILDISLPEIDGYEVLRRMRLIDPKVPAIAFTAPGGNDDVGLRQYALVKPR
jgi:CheY-like chemotaxis protein